VDIIELIARSEWPIVVGGALFLLRHPIKGLLTRISLTKIDAWGLKAEFEQGLDEVDELSPAEEEVKLLDELTLECRDNEKSSARAKYYEGLRPFLYENVSPEAVVLDTWSRVEADVRAMTEALPPVSLKVPLSIEQAGKRLGLDEHEIVSLTVLRRLRNKVAHSADQSLTWDDAERFRRSVERLLMRMKANWEEMRKK
jgi:hypothetical protein